MTARQVPESVSAAGPIANGNGTGSERSHSWWEDWFRHANASQQAHALGLAQQQGVVYLHQLSRAGNVELRADPSSEGELPSSLTKILADKTDGLSPLIAEDVSFFDRDLDEMQQQAVIRALSTPDLFLLQGLPGTGKSRLIAEIVLQAATRGWRTLFLANHPASLDVVLERWTDKQQIFALRYLDPGEKLESLPAWLRAFTPDQQRQAFLEQILGAARDRQSEVETSCQQHREMEDAWPELRRRLDGILQLDETLRDLQARLPHLFAEVTSESTSPGMDSSFSRKIAALREANDLQIAQVDKALAAHEKDLLALELEVDQLGSELSARAPAFHAKKHKQFWTLPFWKNLFNAQLLPKTEALQAQLQDVKHRQEQKVQEMAALREKRSGHQKDFDAAQATAVNEETRQRQEALSAQIQSLVEERARGEAEWGAACDRFKVAPLQPALADLQGAHAAWQHRRVHDEDQCRFARQWSDFVEQTRPQWAVRLPLLANVLAGTMSGWRMEYSFQEAVGGSGHFDLIVVEDAETLTESDLLKVARKSQRCVLVGHALAESSRAPLLPDKMPRLNGNEAVVSTGCWSKLWASLGGEAWPYSWMREQGRLICQLLPLTREDNAYLDREGLADATEIELRILHRPKATPCLAQVIFPPTWTYADAFSFIVREAQEIPMQPLCRTGWWHEDSGCLTWRVAPTSVDIEFFLDVETGVRLGMVADEKREGPRVATVEFTKASGWDRLRAGAWLDRCRKAPDHERVMFLQTPHRFVPPLAKALVRLLFVNDWLPTASPDGSSADERFEFCAVPACKASAWPKVGAGFESDLSAARNAERIPSHLRQGLPARGFVNYLEAQELVRRLESLVQEPREGKNGVTCPIAVLALYQSQVELLRRLIQQSALLQAHTGAIEVSLPSQMHQRECDIVLLSLTRSHSHRCGAFAENPRELPLALTRARTRVLIFGDAGMLAKRTHWQGPLDHLDAQGSHQEGLRLSRILCHAQRPAPSLVLTNG